LEKFGVKMLSLRLRTFSFFCMMLLWLCGSNAWADIYRYRDNNGVWHFSNVKYNAKYEVFLRDQPRAIIKFGVRDRKKYDDIIRLASRQFLVDSSLIKAVIRAESDFNHAAVSSKGAQGLMQLMPGTADDLNVSDPFDPRENIFGGTRYISLLLKRFNYDTTLALAAYNAGPNEVEARNGIPPFPETQTFVKRVLSYYQRYSSE
jgi:soluble lytic murein transglycosylase-like protein